MRREYNQTSYGYDGRSNSADVIGRTRLMTVATGETLKGIGDEH
jgi:hypothetical protein